MKFTSTSLLLLVLAINMPSIQGFLEANYTHFKCKCIQETSAFVPLQQIQQLQIFPAGSGCPNVEIVIWKKNRTTVCLKYGSKFFQRILKMSRRINQSEE
ncbi:PREDICTED: c-X-C motif chemokine 13-like [Chrysochloris asiatica]|uniref:C-X-C motif chemokine 13-like n=1 Tax=Chrysochloris asiatica TaxID=185453 RepID=A0A9B0U5G4_CHRAS|nr:PREDICTED: c-X-C motif chemokine 13-like [Chrysochloris asiatica]